MIVERRPLLVRDDGITGAGECRHRINKGEAPERVRLVRVGAGTRIGWVARSRHRRPESKIRRERAAGGHPLQLGTTGVPGRGIVPRAITPAPRPTRISEAWVYRPNLTAPNVMESLRQNSLGSFIHAVVGGSVFVMRKFSEGGVDGRADDTGAIDRVVRARQRW